MRDFWKMLLAVVCGLVVVQIVKWIFLFGMLGSLTSAQSGKVVIPREGVLDINLSEISVVEQATELSVPAFGASGLDMGIVPLGLRDMVSALDAAAADPGIKFVLLRPDGVTAGMADLDELRAAILRFRQSGKAVVAYIESPGNGSYYLATAADKIYMSSYKGATYQMVGTSASMLFLKDLLDKVGVNVQLIRHGKYKSAGEMFIRSGASPENREQNQVMITSAWKNIAAPVCQAREIDPAHFDALIDDLSLVFPEDFLKEGLVDELMDHETLVEKLGVLAQVPSPEDFKLIRIADYIAARIPVTLPGRSNVAILYADGEIVDGNAYEGVSGDRFVKIIDQLRKDNTVKAVVLRVNSPGGSVSASEKIKSALDLLDKEKPLVASYGNYAASGGYWISNGCRKIFADANTITGSIGVFSMLPDFSKVTKKVGVSVESVGSHKHSDIFSGMRPLDKQELAYMQASVEDIYETFVNIVAEGRSMEPAKVDEIAQGRVWMGSDALSIGLVDEIGTLEDAVFYAASLAGMMQGDYKVTSYPQPLTAMEQFMMLVGGLTEEPSVLEGTAFQTLSRSFGDLTKAEPSRVYARVPYDLVIR